MLLQNHTLRRVSAVDEAAFIEFLAQARVGAPAIASIGGAGTFDGIVLSGLVAALLA